MDLFRQQFIGKKSALVLIMIALSHLLAIFVRDSSLALPVLILIFALVLILSLRSLKWGLLVGFVEVFVGGHGHMIDAEVFGFSLSIRMAIFAAVMLAWLILMVRRKIEFTIKPNRDMPWLLLLIAIAVGSIIGFINNQPGQVFDDMNGYLAIGYLLPLLSIKWNSTAKRELLQVLFASGIWLVFFTLLLSVLFNHLDGKTLSHVYTFVRDARLAEITLQTIHEGGQLAFLGENYWYRIFMQSQFYLVFLMMLIASAMLMMWRGQRLPILVSVSFMLASAALMLSLSRSFVMGLAAAAVVIVIIALTQGHRSLVNVVKRLALMVILLAGAGLIAGGSALLPPKPDISDASFYQTSSDSDRDLAISSRWQLLPEMMTQIWRSPILGSGFGTNVTFISDDPRVRAINPNGEYTTYRFEWGYQDIWLKMGLLGLVAFIWYMLVIAKATRYTIKRHGHAWLALGLASGLVALFIINIFTPFLNHPIGLIAMMIVLPFLDFEGLGNQKVKEVKNVKEVKSVKRELRPSPAMSVEEK